MSVYTHEPTNSPKISRKGCQMPNSVPQVQKLRGPVALLSKVVFPFLQGIQQDHIRHSSRIPAITPTRATGKATKEVLGTRWICYQPPLGKSCQQALYLSRDD